MPSVAIQLDPVVIARLEGLELRARHIMSGMLSGRHRSHRRGQSVEFAEHRDYVLGDDLRYVDWKVYGKTDRLYLKQYEAETSLHCCLALDVSESMGYQGPTAPLSKLQYAECLAATLGHLIIRQGDSVGLAAFDNSLRDFVVGSGNPALLNQLIHVMESASPAGKSDIASAMSALVERLRRRSVVVVLSDLLASGESLQPVLRRLRHARHEVIVVQVLDPAEIDFPFERATLFRGLESLPDVLAEPHGVRRAYLAACRQFLARVEADCRACQVDYVLARTDERLDAPLRRLLTDRLRRRA